MTEEIQIKAEPQGSPYQCKFIVVDNVIDHGAYAFSSETEAKGSALAEEIFALGNIAHILLSESTIFVTLQKEEDWRDIGKNFGAAIRKAFASGNDLISSNLKERDASEKEWIAKINEVLKEEINPAVANHGGVIELMEARNKDLFIKQLFC